MFVAFVSTNIFWYTEALNVMVHVPQTITRIVYWIFSFVKFQVSCHFPLYLSFWFFENHPTCSCDSVGEQKWTFKWKGVCDPSRMPALPFESGTDSFILWQPKYFQTQFCFLMLHESALLCHSAARSLFPRCIGRETRNVWSRPSEMALNMAWRKEGGEGKCRMVHHRNPLCNPGPPCARGSQGHVSEHHVLNQEAFHKEY